MSAAVPTPRRWGTCFAGVAALHACVLFAVLRWNAGPVAAPPLASPMTIELPPLRTPRRPAVAPHQRHEAVRPRPPVHAAQPVVPRAPAPRLAVALPPKAQPRAAERTIAAREPAVTKQDDASPAPLSTAAPQTAASLSPATAASAPVSPAPAVPPSNAVPTWQGLLLARLQQFKRYPSAAQSQREQGTAYLRFTMDRRGDVLSARIDRTSGYAALDDETLALVHRAQPLPAPPPEVAGDPIELVVPVQFFLKPGS